MNHSPHYLIFYINNVYAGAQSTIKPKKVINNKSRIIVDLVGNSYHRPMNKFFTLFALSASLLTSSVSNAKVWVRVFDEIEEPRASIQVKIARKDLKTATVKSVLDQADESSDNLSLLWNFDAKYGSFFLTSANDLTKAPEFLLSGSTRYFSWCFALNGKVPTTGWSETKLTSRSDSIDLFWGYMDGKIENGIYTGDTVCKPVSAALKDPSLNDNKIK